MPCRHPSWLVRSQCWALSWGVRLSLRHAPWQADLANEQRPDYVLAMDADVMLTGVGSVICIKMRLAFDPKRPNPPELGC